MVFLKKEILFDLMGTEGFCIIFVESVRLRPKILYEVE